jgi:fermentation-respiration switch protein FrsA (DUF1100 family)
VVEITLETFSVQEIPVLRMAEADAAGQPVVFFVHGFTGDKSSVLMLGYELAQAGFTTVSFDAPKIYSVDLYRALKPRYADHPERLRLNVHDDAAHAFTHAMRQDVRDWFTTYLMGS